MKASVLLVEDEPYMARYLCTVLKQFGYHLEVISAGVQALKRAATAAFDLVLVDVLLGDGLGTELISPLRRQLPQRPVIVLSGVPPDEEILAECLQKGAFAYVSKTAKVEELVSQLQRALSDPNSAGYRAANSENFNLSYALN